MRHIATALEGYAYRPLLKSETILVEGLRGTRFAQCSLGIVPEGTSARQVFGGPEVPGPFGFATTHPNVIDASGLAAEERSRAIRFAVGEPFTVEGLPGVWMFRSPDRRRLEGDGPQLAEFNPDHPEALRFAKVEHA